MIGNNFSLENELAVVTGGAGMYGKPISKALCEAGATVIVASRNVKKCRAMAERLKREGHKAEGMRLDQGDEESIKSFVRGLIQKYKTVDVLVNNAVCRDGMADLEELTREGLEKEQQVNTVGLMLLTREVIKIMRKQRKGSIINISSIQGINGPRFPVYGETGMSSPVNYTYDKWGMIGFTKWLANYYGKYNIRANSISPGGYIPDESRTDDKNEFYTNYKKLTPLGRFANEGDIKGPVVFLASEASAYITGHNLVMDGGWSSW